MAQWRIQLEHLLSSTFVWGVILFLLVWALFLLAAATKLTDRLSEEKRGKLVDFMFHDSGYLLLALMLVIMLGTALLFPANNKEADRLRVDFIQTELMEQAETYLFYDRDYEGEGERIIAESDDKMLVIQMSTYPDEQGVFDYEILSTFETNPDK